MRPNCSPKASNGSLVPSTAANRQLCGLSTGGGANPVFINFCSTCGAALRGLGHGATLLCMYSTLRAATMLRQ